MTIKFTEKFGKDLLIVNVGSVVLVLTILLIPDSLLRTILGLPFVLFFPGYMIVSSLFPEKNSLGHIARFALSIGLSLSVVPLLGFALNYTPWGVNLYPIITSLYLLTILLSIASYYRRSKLTAERRFNLSLPLKMPKWNTMRRIDKLFLVGVLFVLVFISGLTVYLVSKPKIGEQFTEFYLLGTTGKIADYPLNLTLGENGSIVIGIRNYEHENVTYRIDVSLNNQTIDTIENIQLSHDVTWNQTYIFTPNIVGENLRLTFHLFKEGTTDSYRNLQLWIDVQPT